MMNPCVSTTQRNLLYIIGAIKYNKIVSICTMIKLPIYNKHKISYLFTRYLTLLMYSKVFSPCSILVLLNLQSQNYQRRSSSLVDQKGIDLFKKKVFMLLLLHLSKRLWMWTQSLKK